VGYRHRDHTIDARTIRIFPLYVSGTVTGRDAISVTLRDGGGRRIVLYLVGDHVIVREGQVVGQAELVVGCPIWAHAFAQADGSYLAQDIHLATAAFSGVIVSRQPHLILATANNQRYVLQLLPRAALTYRHLRPLPLSRLSVGSKVTGRAYPAPANYLLVVSLVGWTLSPPPTATPAS
jgi:hypothetical protein